MDLDALAAAGLYDPTAPDAADRRALLEYLTELGCTVPEMIAAERRGRLFGLAGDRIIRPGGDTYTLAEVAQRVGAELSLVERCWRAAGLPDPGTDLAVASEADVEAIAGVVLGTQLLGVEAMLGLVRVIGASTARIAEAESALVRSQISDLTLESSRSEAVTAQAFAAAAQFVPQLAAIIDVLHRHHLDNVRRHVELSDSTGLIQQGGIRYAVGFADLSGFTAASQAVPMAELSRLVTRFEETASDVVHAAGGRVVKFIGDAAMFVAPQPLTGGRIALDLIDELAVEAHLPVRVGLTYGDLLALDGDYFGPSVNLASRLVGLAEPGQALVSTELATRLADSGWALTTLPARAVRGYDEPVVSVDLQRVAAPE